MMALAANAQEQADMLATDTLAQADTLAYIPRVSLLTCSPGTEVWQQYGHTAIRFEDTEREVDVVFNYGLFSFNEPHFIWRFCLGHTDYLVGAETYESFKKEYMERGSSITEQQLDLTSDEVTRFWNLITLECRPENRTYRYNFLYNNCSTKARDVLYKSLDTPVSIARTDSVSFRSVLHRFNSAYPWTSFGIDLLLGVKADQPVAHDLQEFAPLSLEDSFSKATRNGGKSFVAGITVIQSPVDMKGGRHFTLTPVQTMILVLLITAIICTLELLTMKRQWWYDVVIYSLQGITGIVVAFLFFFSTHPTVDSNVLVIVLNPLIFVLLPFILRQSRRHTFPWAAWVEMGLIVLLAVLWLFVQQDIPIAAWIFIAALFLRTGHLILTRRKKTMPIRVKC